MKFNIGDAVAIDCKCPRGPHHPPGTVGFIKRVIKQYAGDNQPYRVHANNGKTFWHKEECLTEVTANPQYITTKIDLSSTDCDPEIAGNLENGVATLCECWDNDYSQAKRWWVIGYSGYVMSYPYQVVKDNNGKPDWSKWDRFTLVKPITKKRYRIMPVYAAFLTLLDEGYEFNPNGDLCNEKTLNTIPATEFHKFGKVVEDKGDLPDCIVKEL